MYCSLMPKKPAAPVSLKSTKALDDRPNVTQVRFSEPELDLLLRLAKEEDRPLANWIRWATLRFLKSPPAIRPIEQDDQDQAKTRQIQLRFTNEELGALLVQSELDARPLGSWIHWAAMQMARNPLTR